MSDKSKKKTNQEKNRGWMEASKKQLIYKEEQWDCMGCIRKQFFLLSFARGRDNSYLCKLFISVNL